MFLRGTAAHELLPLIKHRPCWLRNTIKLGNSWSVSENEDTGGNNAGYAGISDKTSVFKKMNRAILLIQLSESLVQDLHSRHQCKIVVFQQKDSIYKRQFMF